MRTCRGGGRHAHARRGSRALGDAHAGPQCRVQRSPSARACNANPWRLPRPARAAPAPAATSPDDGSAHASSAQSTRLMKPTGGVWHFALTCSPVAFAVSLPKGLQDRGGSARTDGVGLGPYGWCCHGTGFDKLSPNGLGSAPSAGFSSRVGSVRGWVTGLMRPTGGVCHLPPRVAPSRSP